LLLAVSAAFLIVQAALTGWACCARATRGDAAAPPTSVRNSRRLIASPGTVTVCWPLPRCLFRGSSKVAWVRDSFLKLLEKAGRPPISTPKSLTVYVCEGWSSTDLTASKSNFRSTPETRHSRPDLPCRFRARKRLMHCSMQMKSILLTLLSRAETTSHRSLRNSITCFDQGRRFIKVGHSCRRRRAQNAPARSGRGAWRYLLPRFGRPMLRALRDQPTPHRK
jgi:hypothetical protein